MKTSILIHILLLNLLCLALPAKAQQKFTISGYVQDAASGESLTGATVFLKEQPQYGAVANTYGFFSLTAPAGTYTLVAQSIGYQPLEQQVNLNKSHSLNLKLRTTTYEVKAVEVVAEKQQDQTRSTQMGTIELPMEQIKTLPVLFGETDILKTIQLLPGVKSGGEGNTGFYVRGGGPDQNLVLLDEAVVYNPGHLFNFFSVFNSDAIRNTTLIKGSMPARYGGRLSSVLDISMKEGNRQEFHGEGGIGLIASRVTLQGPIRKDESSFMISGRRTYIDALAKPFLKNTEQGGVPYYFYDLNAKVNYSLSQRDRLYLSGYFGRDVGKLTLSDGRFNANFDWGNSTGTLRWNHLFSDKLFMNLSAIYNDYRFVFDADFDTYSSRLFTGVKDYNLKLDFEYFPDVRHNIQYGLNYTYHTLTPRNATAQASDGATFSTDRVREKYAHEAAAYLSDDWALTDQLTLNAGLRASFFRQLGPFTLYNFNNQGGVADSTVFAANEKVKDFYALEPRLSFNYRIDSRSSVKAGYTRTAQYLHLVSNAFTALPLDIWVPSSHLVEPQRATQYAAGYFRNFKEKQYEGSVEVYYKDLQNQLEYREDYAPGPSNRDLEYEFVSGTGYSYGTEFFLRKNFGRLQGWAGYTWSRTMRQFPDLNEGREFPARFDRRHDVSLVSSYKLNDHWTLGGTFVYGTGQAITIPVRRYIIEGTVNFQYGDRNSFRMEPYHRLDLSATFQKKTSKKVQTGWTFAVFNVYGRKNPFFYYIDTEGDPFGNNLTLKAKKVTIFAFPVPSVTWNFSF